MTTRSKSRPNGRRPTKSRPSVLVIYKKSQYQTHVLERRSKRVERLIRKRDPIVRRLRQAHNDHVRTIEQAKKLLRDLGTKAVFRYLKSTHPADDYDLVVTLGGDGTLLWASHIVGPEVPMLAINTAPWDSVGYFCAGDAQRMRSLLPAALAGELKGTRLTRMRVTVDGNTVSERVLNDVLFSHQCPAETTRYIISCGGVDEEHKSSGIWVGPAAGSTAAQRSAGGRVLPIGSERLQFVVRELYRAGGVDYRLAKGLLQPGEELLVRSKTPACLYLDGPHRVFHADMGAPIRFDRSEQPLTLLGLRSRTRQR